MNALRNAAQGFRKVWGMGEEDDYEDEESASTSRRARYETQPQQPAEAEANETEGDYEAVETRSVSRIVYAPTNSARSGRQSEGEDGEQNARFSSSRQPVQSNGRGGRGGSGSGGAGSGGAGNLRSVAMPLRARDKNIYTLKPKTMDEASLAADYLKTGCAVVVNLEEVERMVAVRIIDFMSGVCYGLEDQGHAMKLGDVIFLFTPGDFEITSDEVDYAENRDIIFKDVSQQERDDAKAEAQTQAQTAQSADGGNEVAGERRSWER